MSVFVDTSGVIAVLDASDQAHKRAALAWTMLVHENRPLVTSNYVLSELVAIAQNRLGLGAVRDIDHALTPLMHIVWVDQDLHSRGLSAMLLAARRKLSLVDCISFEIMRREGISQCFAIDKHFAEQGFERIP